MRPGRTRPSLHVIAGLERIVKKTLLSNLVKYGLGFALLGWMLWANWKPSGDSPGLETALQRDLSVAPLVAAVILCLASLLLTFYRWYLLVRMQNLPFAVSDAMRLGLVGFAMSN